MQLLATSFLALYLAHLLTDFVLQSDHVVAGKRRGSALSYLEHGGIHFFAAVLSLGFAVPDCGGRLGSMVFWRRLRWCTWPWIGRRFV